MTLVKSKQRVADHGEVFTPAWMVEAMLDLVKDESERIDSRFLEPACGDGNFMGQILRRKLAAVDLKYSVYDIERRHFALLGLMCIYGIELLADNIAECRANMLAIFADHLILNAADDLYRAADYVLSLNIVHGDALTMQFQTELPQSPQSPQPIVFAEWEYLGDGEYQRRDFRLDVLTAGPDESDNGSLFAAEDDTKIVTPIKVYAPMTVSDLAAVLLNHSPAVAI